MIGKPLQVRAFIGKRSALAMEVKSQWGGLCVAGDNRFPASRHPGFQQLHRRVDEANTFKRNATVLKVEQHLPLLEIHCGNNAAVTQHYGQHEKFQ